MSQPNQSRSIAADPDAVWLVTGCSSGFGQALAKALHIKGKRLVATARQVPALAYLPDGDSKVLKVELDVTKRDTIDSAVSAAHARFGRIDVVINNAGIGVIGPLEDVSDEQTRHQFEVNVFGVINVVRATAPVFRNQNRGLYINFASMAGQAYSLSLGVYTPSKFAVEGISEAIRDEMAPHGVRVLIVEPGPFNTEWLGKNAIWAKEDRGTYPNVWDFAAEMKAMYADRKAVGDPEKAAEAIISAATQDDLPFRLALHELSVESTRRKLAAVTQDLDRMEPVSREVHYR